MVMHSLSPDVEYNEPPVVGSLSRASRRRSASPMSTTSPDGQQLDIGLLYDRHGGMVYRRVRRFYSTEEAEEVVQEVFLRLMSTSSTFRGESAVTTWLYQVTTRHCLNRLRNARRRRELLDHHGAPSWGQPIAPARQEARVFLDQVWATLDEEQLLIGTYHFVDGMSHAAIAELMGVSRRTVGNRLQALRDKVEAAAEPKPRADEPDDSTGGTP